MNQLEMFLGENTRNGKKDVKEKLLEEAQTIHNKMLELLRLRKNPKKLILPTRIEIITPSVSSGGGQVYRDFHSGRPNIGIELIQLVKNEWERMINVAHETTHYFHMVAFPEDYKKGTYVYNELVAIAGSFLYFKRNSVIGNFKKTINGQHNLNERAFVKLLDDEGENFTETLLEFNYDHPKRSEILRKFDIKRDEISNGEVK